MPQGLEPIAKPEPPNNQPQPSRWRWVKAVLVLWLCVKISGCYLVVPSPWGPKIGGTLPNGTKVYFQARKVGGETDDRLTVIAPDAERQHFWVDRIHAGFDHVKIKYIDHGKYVWVESDGEVGASIDVAEGDFRAEIDQKHEWAKLSKGTTLDAGYTGSIIWLIGPW